MIVMKNRVFTAVLGLIMLVNMFGCTRNKNDAEKHVEDISTEIQIDISEPISSNYGCKKDGFHGDGNLIAQFKYDSASGKRITSQIQQSGKWREFPLSENINILLYGGNKDGVEYSFDNAKELGLPHIEHGYYFVHNRNYEAKNIYSDSEILDENAYSFNVTTAIYDTDSNILYYIEIDT